MTSTDDKAAGGFGAGQLTLKTVRGCPFSVIEKSVGDKFVICFPKESKA
jgi:hypothetical protein